jgi:hypothetical protein
MMALFLTFYFGDDTVVGEKRIPAFHQRKGMISHVNDKMDANPRVWKSFLSAALISNAPAELKVGLRTGIRYKTWGKKRKHHKLDLQGLLPVGRLRWEDFGPHILWLYIYIIKIYPLILQGEARIIPCP